MMLNRTSAFFSLSKSVAENFLQTALIVDDKAYFEKPTTQEKSENTRIEKPVGQSRTGEDYTLQAPGDNFETNGQSHLLDAKSVIDSFARKGIVCSVLKPAKEEMNSLVDTLPKLAVNSDLIILDWDLHKDKGRTILELIERIVTNNEAPHQLRLIAIYTGETDVKGVANRIKRRLEKNKDLQIKEDSSRLLLDALATRIIVFAKPETQVAPEFETKKISFINLANIVAEEFTAITCGLVSNVALESLSQIRKNTHKILTKLSAQLDPPYLTHRALQDDPRDAEEHLLFLIGEELQAILEESHVSEKANLEVITNWFKDNEFSLPDESEYLSDTFVNKLNRELSSENSFGEKKEKIENLFDGRIPISEKLKNELSALLQSDNKEAEIIKEIKQWCSDKAIPQLIKPFFSLSPANFLELLEVGIADWEYLNGNQKKKGEHKYPFTDMFCTLDTDNKNLDEKFAVATTMRSFYGNEKRRLTLGTIIKEAGDKASNYWICIQPRCDTYRISSPRMFPFLPLNKVQGENNFDLVVEENSEYIRLVIEKKPFNMRLIVFEPDERQIITTNDGYYYDLDKGKFLWVGELRAEIAQRLSNSFAAELSRVGVKESQWLRRWSS